jgi:hypothetical protein
MNASLPAFDADDPRARSQHLLALPPNVEPGELEVLALSRFGRVAWEEDDTPRPRTGLLPAVTAAFGVRAVPAAVMAASRLRLGRQSALVGPYGLTSSHATALGLPASSDTVWVVETPWERGEAPFAFGGDRDGLRRAFPDGLPVREEERVVRWLVAAARRLGGAVRIAGNRVVLAPDPDAAVDLTLYTTRWPAPEELLANVRRLLPKAELPTGGGWAGPAIDRSTPGRHQRVRPRPETGETTALRRTLDTYGVADAELRSRLHAEADAYDEMMPTGSDPGTYGVLVDLGLDGHLEVVAERLAEPPMVLREAPWASAGLVALRVRWQAEDPEQQEDERPSALHRVARGRATPLVNALTARLWDAYDGEIADEADFLIHPDDLRPEV